MVVTVLERHDTYKAYTPKQLFSHVDRISRFANINLKDAIYSSIPK